jgi:hypothetical protein
MITARRLRSAGRQDFIHARPRARRLSALGEVAETFQRGCVGPQVGAEIAKPAPSPDGRTRRHLLAMSALRAQLRSGTCGASWVPPESTEVVQEDESLLVLRDPVAKVVWQVRSSPFPFALDAAHDEVLRADLERSAREAFDNAWKPPAEGEVQARRRTEDPTWSPLIEHSRLDLPGGAALRLVRRISYQPGKEIVAGHVIVPTALGHLDFCALARATVTGLRETVLTALRLDRDREIGAAEPDDAQDSEIGRPFPPQSAYDDPGLDAQFPEHPLSLVRQAVGKLRDSVAIKQAAPQTDDVVRLMEPNCTFTAPPRYVPVPAGVLGMHPMLRLLVRSGIESWQRNIEVWRLDNVRLRRGDPRNELCELARDTVAKWEHEGATGIQTEVAAVEDFQRRPQVQQSVSMTAAERAFRTIFRWWVEPDGVVFRLGSSGPPSIPDAEHVTILDGLQASWRRLDAVSPSRRPWWRVW